MKQTGKPMMEINMTGTRTKVVAGGVGLALATVVLVATHAVHAAEAQRGGGRGARMEGPGGAGRAGAFLPPLRQLDLTDEQREQVRTAIGESREAARTHARETRTARQALAEAVTTGAVDEDRLRTLGAEQGRLAGDGAVGRAQVYAAVWQILTPEQQARAEEIRAEREERRGQIVAAGVPAGARMSMIRGCMVRYQLAAGIRTEASGRADSAPRASRTPSRHPRPGSGTLHHAAPDVH